MKRWRYTEMSKVIKWAKKFFKQPTSVEQQISAWDSFNKKYGM